jgi:hypothetical protein
MPSTVSTACSKFQATLRSVWASGSAMADITAYLGITKDQLIRLRGVLELPLRLDRSKRCKPPRHRDPTPAEIAAACAEIRRKHAEQRKGEDPSRVYQRADRDLIRFRLAIESARSDDALESLLDNFNDE